MENEIIQNGVASYGLTFFVGFIFGLVIGYFASRFISKKAIANWERTLISIVVLMVWGASTVFDIVIVSYNTPTAVHAIMGLIVGYFFEGTIADFFNKKGGK